MPIEWDGPFLQISSSLQLDQVEIGDAITVWGNSDAVGVATRLKGEVNGIGPDELEVSAKFVPGNSGSPIIHDKTGLVIGIVSHMKDLSNKTKWTEDSELADIRRFGFRLDGEIAWQQVSLADFYRQGALSAKYEDRTLVMAHTAYMMMNERTIMTGYANHATIGHLFSQIDSNFSWSRGTSSGNNLMMLERFTNALQNELQSDRQSTKSALTVEFFKERFAESDAIREAYMKQLRSFSF